MLVCVFTSRTGCANPSNFLSPCINIILYVTLFGKTNWLVRITVLHFFKTFTSNEDVSSKYETNVILRL